MKKIILCLSVVILLLSCGESGAQREKGGTSAVVGDTAKKAVSTPKRQPTITVYIENSGSMDGYVKGVTEFEQAVYNYLSIIKRKDITDALNLYYINSEILPQKPDVKDFIEKLDPKTFKDKGGNRKFTEISNIIDTILNETKENTVSILVTDGVFSLGNLIDSKEYLVNQRIGIANDVTEFLKKNKESAIVVYQLSSNFDGYYYCFDKIRGKEIGIPINENRPYYVWVIGNIENVSRLCKEIPDEKFEGKGVENRFSIISGTPEVNYAVRDNTGNFKISLDNPKIEINKLKKDDISKKVQFSVNADFSKLLLDDKFLSDISNYEIIGDYQLNTVSKSPANSQGYTYSLNFIADRVYKEEIIVRLKKQLPAWVKDKNDDDGYSYVKDKTFGIYSQIRGVFDAFTDKSLYYTEIKIKIN
jgi:hypothetical protein